MNKETAVVKVNKKNNLFPDSFANLTLNELISREDVDIVKKGNKLSLSRKTASDNLTLEYTTFDEAESITLTTVKKTKKKKELADLAKKMYKEGKTQNEIAQYIDASQPYVSKLLKL
ncbi:MULTISPECIES: hypothetical protein [Saccharibacillus]|uniref:hypothetical protein n=1 Tax=Saccharibacillus TaxID=456492 RepID=UPI00123C35CA|nr:hypothetical protein [Saccharibacillus sp. WB 17]MWJ30098.1 hypothetical protein [Saccharibacillus sp. WB 17]